MFSVGSIAVSFSRLATIAAICSSTEPAPPPAGSALTLKQVLRGLGGQGGHVELAVDRQRQGVDAHEPGRDHVLGQP
jgi:hypothetical protein